MNKPFLAGCSAEFLTSWCEKRKFPKFRVKQLCNWLYTQVEINPDAMLNLPGNMRAVRKGYIHRRGGIQREIQRDQIDFASQHRSEIQSHFSTSQVLAQNATLYIIAQKGEIVKSF